MDIQNSIISINISVNFYSQLGAIGP